MKQTKQVLIFVGYLFFLTLNFFLPKPLAMAMSVKTRQELTNRIIVIDPGHGGRDNGAEVGNAVEDELNLKVALVLQQLIEQAGGSVVLIRDGDYDLSSQEAINHKKEDLKQRVTLMEQENTDLFVSIHMNKFSQSYVQGGQVFYQVNHPFSLLLARAIQEEFKQQLHSNKIEKVGNYYILNNTTTTGVLIECGFMSNPEELSLLQSKEYQAKLAYAIYSGIVLYFRNAVFF